MRVQVAVVVSCGLFLAGCSSAEGPDSNRSGPAPDSSAALVAVSADDVAQAVRDRLDVLKGTYPAALALVRVGEETRFVSAGFAERGSEEELTDRHRFQIGSVSKPMLAVAVMQLVESGELSLDDTVEERVPGLVPGGDDITIEHLLAHRSGLFNYIESDRFRWRADWRPTELVGLATDERPMFAPGEQGSYSNTNYVVLGLVVEEVTGRSLADVLQERVFAPARMSDTSMTPEGITDPPLVRGYDGRRDVTSDDMSMAWGAGAVVSSARDVDRFLSALTTGVLLDDATVEDMRSWRGDLVNVGGVTYGLGLGELDIHCDVEMVGHSGGLPGFATEAWTTPDGSRSVVAMVNDQGSQAPVGLVTAAVCG